MQLTAREIAGMVGGTLTGNPDTIVTGVAGIKEARPGEVAFVALAGRHALALMDVIDLVPGQLPVLRIAEHVEVDVAAAGIGVASFDQAFH